jgi:hypothetical protein
MSMQFDLPDFYDSGFAKSGAFDLDGGLSDDILDAISRPLTPSDPDDLTKFPCLGTPVLDPSLSSPASTFASEWTPPTSPSPSLDLFSHDWSGWPNDFTAPLDSGVCGPELDSNPVSGLLSPISQSGCMPMAAATCDPSGQDFFAPLMSWSPLPDDVLDAPLNMPTNGSFDPTLAFGPPPARSPSPCPFPRPPSRKRRRAPMEDYVGDDDDDGSGEYIPEIPQGRPKLPPLSYNIPSSPPAFLNTPPMTPPPKRRVISGPPSSRLKPGPKPKSKPHLEGKARTVSPPSRRSRTVSLDYRLWQVDSPGPELDFGDYSEGPSEVILAGNVAIPLERTASEGDGDEGGVSKEVIRSLYAPLPQPHGSTGGKRYICLIDGCGRSFPRRTAVESHIQTHLEDKPFVCPQEGWYVLFGFASCRFESLRLIVNGLQ